MLDTVLGQHLSRVMRDGLATTRPYPDHGGEAFRDRSFRPVDATMLRGNAEEAPPLPKQRSNVRKDVEPFVEENDVASRRLIDHFSMTENSRCFGQYGCRMAEAGTLPRLPVTMAAGFPAVTR